MPNPKGRVLSVEEKHSKYLLQANTDEELGEVCLNLVAQRVIDGNWYFDEDLIAAKQIIEAIDGMGAWRFLLSRKDAEYEFVELLSVR